MNVESVLEDALRAHTADVRPDPDARTIIAERLAADRLTDDSAPGRSWQTRVALIASAASVVALAGIGVALSRAHDKQAADVPTSSGAVLPGYPLPSSQYFVAIKGAFDDPHRQDQVVRASDGKIVATLPAIAGERPDEPQLSPDGRTAYAVWGNGTRLGSIDLRTGKTATLITRRGEIGSPVLSADGSTLAYQWTPKLDGNDVTSIVIRSLATGAERMLPHAPAGPQLISLALSPSGDRLALVPTDRQPRPLWIVSTTASRPFDDPVVVTATGCRSELEQPRWTPHGLVAVQHCLAASVGPRTRADAVSVDVTAKRATTLFTIAPNDSSAFLAVVESKGVRLYVTTREDEPGRVSISGPHRATRVVRGLSDLAVSGSE